jgi:hydrogenase nickel incorporation protein HypB
MALNNQYAAANRQRLEAARVKTLNLLSSPGSGKTTLLSRTLQELAPHLQMAVIVGDLATDNDAQRLRVGGATAVQIQTGSLCHLEAAMVARALDALNLEALELLFIENVGNLVCPAAYDLGESAKVVLFSTTEGEDKPLKYPRVFKEADLVLLTKSDLAEVLGFDRRRALENLRLVAPQARVLEVSARSGAGMPDWYHYLFALLGRVMPQNAHGV